MRKMAIAVAASLVCCTLLLSCKKDIAKDIIVTEVSSKPNQNIKHCNITYMEGRYSSLFVRTYTFEYNQKGDPVLITPSHVETGQTRYEFRYDKHGRLTDWIGVYNNNSFEFWHEYGYDNNNRIITDSMYIFGTYGDEPVVISPYYILPVTNYEYDAQDRIKKTTSIYPPGSGIIYETKEYHYDGNGNLIKPGVVYDNKVNFHRLHPVWMFIDRDYSMNNPMTATAYNAQGLPTSFAVGATLDFFLHLVLPVTRIDYDCKGNPHDNN